MFHAVICGNMIRLFWVFVLVAVAVPCNARPHKCEQRERSIADLELAENSLNMAKQLYPNCEKENATTNSSECSKKDKSLGFIDVALDLVSNAKKNIPLCPHIPTEEPLTPTEEPLTPTEEPLTPTEEASSTTKEPTPEVTTDDFRPVDCLDLLAAGHVTSGVYSVWPQEGRADVRVRCDMDTDGGGWTVIQRRGNFSRQENFDRNWEDYKNGFGNLERDFWLGNDNIFALTNQGDYSLRMDMTAANQETAYALFREFRIEDESSNYKLHVGGYSGTAGDGVTDLNLAMFSTKDRNNDKGTTTNCAVERKGAFWSDKCAYCNPNGLYRPGVDGRTSMNYMNFRDLYGLFSFEMKVKRLFAK